MDWTIAITWAKGFGAMVLPALGTNMALWANKAAADGKFERYEIVEGLKTVSQVFFVTLGAFVGAQGMGLDVSPLATALTTSGLVLAAKIGHSIFKKKPKAKKAKK